MIKKFESFESNSKLNPNNYYDILDKFVELEKYNPNIIVGVCVNGEKNRKYFTTYYDIKLGEIQSLEEIKTWSKNLNLSPCIQWQIALKSEGDKIEDLKIFKVMEDIKSGLDYFKDEPTFQIDFGSSNFSNNIQILNFTFFD